MIYVLERKTIFYPLKKSVVTRLLNNENIVIAEGCNTDFEPTFEIKECNKIVTISSNSKIFKGSLVDYIHNAKFNIDGFREDCEYLKFDTSGSFDKIQQIGW